MIDCLKILTYSYSSTATLVQLYADKLFADKLFADKLFADKLFAVYVATVVATVLTVCTHGTGTHGTGTHGIGTHGIVLTVQYSRYIFPRRSNIVAYFTPINGVIGMTHTRLTTQEYLAEHKMKIDPDVQAAWDKADEMKIDLDDRESCLVEIGRLLTLDYLDVAELKRTLIDCLKGEY